MTIGEARYVLANRSMYPDRMVLWAMDIVAEYERQHPEEVGR